MPASFKVHVKWAQLHWVLTISKLRHNAYSSVVSVSGVPLFVHVMEMHRKIFVGFDTKRFLEVNTRRAIYVDVNDFSSCRN